MRGHFFSIKRKRCFLKVLLDSTEQDFQSSEAGSFMGAAPSALIPGQGDDQGRNCCPLLLPLLILLGHGLHCKLSEEIFSS